MIVFQAETTCYELDGIMFDPMNARDLDATADPRCAGPRGACGGSDGRAGAAVHAGSLRTERRILAQARSQASTLGVRAPASSPCVKGQRVRWAARPASVSAIRCDKSRLAEPVSRARHTLKRISRGDGRAEVVMNQDEPSKQENLPSMAPPPALDDDWIRWLTGEWETSAESDNGPYKNWVQARGRMKVELGLGGQFVTISREGSVIELSDEYVRHLKENLRVPDDELEKLRRMTFANLEVQTVDPKSGLIIGYLFDSWRCVAKGKGRREGNKETMSWEWSAAGRGTSERVTEKLDDARFVMTEKYVLPDGGAMEDRSVATRKK
jgi:hypothetical protein